MSFVSFRTRALRKLKAAATRFGYDTTNWLRIEQIRSWTAKLDEYDPQSVLEISPARGSIWSRYKGYRAVEFPEFDICKDVLAERFDVIIADQVLEHVPDPLAAMKNIRSMLKPGGTAMIATPFLFRVHERPYDFFRWTKSGLSLLLQQAGYSDDAITSQAWGNASCVRAHTTPGVKDFGFGRDLSNDPEYPLMVWAFARNTDG